MPLYRPTQSLFDFRPSSNYDPENDLVCLTLWVEMTSFTRVYVALRQGRRKKDRRWVVDEEFMHPVLAFMRDKCGGKEVVVHQAKQMDSLYLEIGTFDSLPFGTFCSEGLISRMEPIHRSDCARDEPLQGRAVLNMPDGTDLQDLVDVDPGSTVESR